MFRLIKPFLERNNDNFVRSSAALSIGLLFAGTRDTNALLTLQNLLPEEDPIIYANTCKSIGLIFESLEDPKLVLDLIFYIVEQGKYKLNKTAILMIGYLLHGKEETTLKIFPSFLLSREALLAFGLAFHKTCNNKFLETLKLSLNDQKISPEIRGASALALGLGFEGSGRSDILRILEPMLKENEIISKNFLTSLGFLFHGIGNSKILEIFEPFVLQDYYDDVISEAIYGLGIAFHATFEETILTILNPLIKKMELYLSDKAVLALGLIFQGSNSKKALKILKPLLKDDNWFTRKMTALALGLISHGSWTETPFNLLLSLAKDPNEEVRYMATLSLGLLFQNLKERSVPEESAFHVLKPFLYSDCPYIRAGASLGLGIAYQGINYPKALNTLQEVLKKEEDWYAQGNLLLGVGHLAVNKRQNIPIKIDLPLGALITTLFNDLDLWLIDISLHSVKKLKTERKRRILEKEMLEKIPNIDFLIRSYIYNQMQPIITNTNQLFNQTSSVITSIKQLYEQTQLKTSDISFLSTVRENLQDFLYYLELNQYTLSDYQIDLLYSLCEEKEREVKHHIEELLNAYKKSVEEKEKKEEIVKIFKEKAKIGKALFGEYINKIEKNSTDYQRENNQKEFQKVSMEDLITEFSNDFKLWVMTGTWPKKSKKI